MKLAYFSPLTPQRSGISDYSEELLAHLAAAAEITLFVDGFQPMNRELTERFELLDYRREPAHLQKLNACDAALYHMGNDHRYHTGMFAAMQTRPGVVVFHDFALQDFFMGLSRDRNDLQPYLDEVEFCYGPKARREAADFLASGAIPAIFHKPLEFPLNCRIARSAEGIIVHSSWQAAQFRKIAPAVPLAHIKHHITSQAAATPRPNEQSRTAPVKIASFGLITPDKGIERALQVLAKLRNDYDFCYTLVGSDSNFPGLSSLIERFGLTDRVRVTGHVSLHEFQQRILETDIALCLRERSVGATSGSLCRIMAAGVAAIVSDVGAFSEFPDKAVVKVEHNEYEDQFLEAYLRNLIEEPRQRERIGSNARAYVLAEHRIEDSAARYLAFLKQVIAARPREFAQTNSRVSEVEDNPSEHQLLTLGQGETTAVVPTGLSQNIAQGELSQTGRNGKGWAGTSRGRGLKVEGLDYKKGAVDYLSKITEERRHHLRTKPFYNLANKPVKYKAPAMDEDTHRHFCDFANIAMTLALEPGSRILDVGCGSGWLSEYFARLGYVVKGIDISPDLIEMSRERIARVPYGADHETPLRCTFEVHDVELAPLPEKFDAAICYDSLHHFEDDAAVIHNIAQMLDIGGVLFILEGDRPEAGSESEDELRQVMHEFGTLESPFDFSYLRQLLEESGFAITGDYVSVNGLFPRELLKADQLAVSMVDTNYHYVACKKVAHGAHAATVPDSREPGRLSAEFSLLSPVPNPVIAGQLIDLEVQIRNTGDTLWLAAPEPRTGIVMPAERIFDAFGALVSEIHGDPVLPYAVAPGEIIKLRLRRIAPHRSGRYTLKLDLVDQHICWFEQSGSEPLVIPFEVSDTD